MGRAHGPPWSSLDVDDHGPLSIARGWPLAATALDPLLTLDPADPILAPAALDLAKRAGDAKAIAPARSSPGLGANSARARPCDGVTSGTGRERVASPSP
jgi:hypothetical protein